MRDKKKKLRQVYKLYDLFKKGKIPTLAEHEVNPELPKGSRENYLYFTLPPCINFQRSSPAMWKAALATYFDPKTQYLFFPEKVVKKSYKALQKDLLKHKLALQPNKHTDIWLAISRGLYKYFNSDPRELIKAGHSDVKEIHRIIQQDLKDDFPYIRGPKLSNYWLFILSQYTDIKLRQIEAISIIPDTHVMQCSVKLGLVQEGAGPLDVVDIWYELLKEERIHPVDMHPVLWNWSRNNFLPEV